MYAGIRNLVALIMLSSMLFACGRLSGDPDLLRIESNTDGPDEFAILPGKPLQSPENFTNLPTPTPGGSNLTDPTPREDAVAALGGRPELLQRGGAYGPDSSLLAYTTRFGVSSGIRAELAAADLEFRRQNPGRIMERIFNVNRYNRAYEAQSLDQRAEMLRLRRLGIRTAAAPPPSVE